MQAEIKDIIKTEPSSYLPLDLRYLGPVNAEHGSDREAVLRRSDFLKWSALL